MIIRVAFRYGTRTNGGTGTGGGAGAGRRSGHNRSIAVTGFAPFSFGTEQVRQQSLHAFLRNDLLRKRRHLALALADGDSDPFHAEIFERDNPRSIHRRDPTCFRFAMTVCAGLRVDRLPALLRGEDGIATSASAA